MPHSISPRHLSGIEERKKKIEQRPGDKREMAIEPPISNLGI
jgi:hypothetical protein